jgi:O-antigen/teichoic acid export membrane protein
MVQTAQMALPPKKHEREQSPEGIAAHQPIGSGLRSNFVWTLSGNVVYAACQWTVLIVLAKLGSAEAVGQFALGLAVTAPVMLLANLQLTALQATDATRAYRFGHYLALRLLTISLALAVIAGIALGVGFSLETTAVILAVGVAKAFESISDTYHGLMQQHGRMERVAWSLMLKGPLSVLAMTAGICFAGGVVGGTIALACAWGLLLACYDVRSTAWLQKTDADLGPVGPGRFSPCWDWRALGRLAWLALPLGIVAMLYTLSTNIPRYFVEHYLGERLLGIFAALSYVTVIGVILSNSLGQAAAPRLARHYAAGDLYGFRLMVLKLAAVGVVLGSVGVVAALLVGRPLLTLLYRAEYAEYAEVFAGIMAGAGLWCIATMFIYAATVARRNRSQAVAAAVVTVATLVASATLIQEESLTGAVLATVASGAAALLAFGTIFVTTGKAVPADAENARRPDDAAI